MPSNTISHAEAIRQWRTRMNWTQTHAAKQLGISRQYLCMVEAGKREPSPTLVLLTHALERLATYPACSSA